MPRKTPDDAPPTPEEVIAHYRSRAAAFTARTQPTARRKAAAARRSRKPDPQIWTRDEHAIAADETLSDRDVRDRTGRKLTEVWRYRKQMRALYTDAQRDAALLARLSRED